ncbi:MAG: (2Fe-2S) ferredoxin domain-containing protein [Christensenellales bacterium]|jgi:NADP-reducing hydrogenase subunit HndB
MKSIEELMAIRAKAQQAVTLRKEDGSVRVVVGMATCGIAAGARPVLLKFVEEVQKRGLNNVMVTQSGCLGICALEPMVQVFTPDQEKVTYCKVTPDMVARIVTEHIVNNKPVEEYTYGAYIKE